MLQIEKLTDAQKARAAEFRDWWMQIGLCTDPADRPRAEAAVCEMYRQGGLEPPAKIVWCGSPLSQGLIRSIMVDKKPIESVWSDVGHIVRDSVAHNVEHIVRHSIEDSVSHSVWQSVWARVGNSV